MENAVFIAKILGPVLAIFGFWFLTHAKQVQEMIKSKGSDWGFHVMGLLYLIVGMTSITLYNVWAWNIYLAVTLLGWIIFLRGIQISFFFNWILKRMSLRKWTVHPLGPVSLLYGLLLIWIGYFMK